MFIWKKSFIMIGHLNKKLHESDTMNILSVGTMDGLVMVGDLVGRTDGMLEGIVLGANKKTKKSYICFQKTGKKISF